MREALGEGMGIPFGMGIVPFGMAIVPFGILWGTFGVSSREIFRNIAELSKDYDPKHLPY